MIRFMTNDGWTREMVASLLIDNDLNSVIPMFANEWENNYFAKFKQEDGRYAIPFNCYWCWYWRVLDESKLTTTEKVVTLSAKSVAFEKPML